MNTISIFKKPSEKITPLFYTFNQNNSGGYFVVDKKVGISEIVIIEAYGGDHAYSRLKKIGKSVNGFSNYCPCCGERWSDWFDDDDGTREPEIYGQPVETAKGTWIEKDVYIHHLDGKVEHCVLQHE